MAWRSNELESLDVTVDGGQEAYPVVHSMNAALYFDTVKSFGDWRVVISSRADKMLRKTRKADKKTFEIVIKKIRELSKGHFSADNHKRLSGSFTLVPVFEAKMTRDLRLVYQIDLAPEDNGEGEIQVIKIFGIHTHAQLDGRFWDSVSHQLSRYGKAYSDRCNQRSSRQGHDVFLPCSFPPREESALTEISQDYLELPAQVWEDIHSLLHLDKYVTLSQALLFSMLADLDVQHVFSVSPREKEIIEHPHSCYVLGRSGTGKTTTMLFKMLGLERAWEQRGDEVPKARQLFVTKSRMLSEKVEEYFRKLMTSLSTGCKSPEELKELAKAQHLTQEGEALVDKDEEVDHRIDLPARYSLLTEDHFPLFITFDHLCKLLEADLTENPIQHTNRNLISARVFSHSYWPRFPQTLTKGLDSSMVFSEFIGVIKGSEEALAYSNGFLDQTGYERLSSRTQPAFAHQRAVIYDLFEAYLKLKKQRGHYDTADRTRALIRSLQKEGISGQQVDYLYVDEAQDNLLIDAMILRALCKNPQGLFWAGDTAQTISVGSSFRFDDLKSFLFRMERKGPVNTTGRSADGPRMFQLAVNYRSHGGIVDCAHSIIELITKFWPYTIDSLAPEQGVVGGLKPVFLGAHASDQDLARYTQSLFGNKESHIELGAEQCIIVRNDAARDELREQVGDVGMIMTPYESKGLEFNDVLLFNFFKDSTMTASQWRVILNALGPSQRSAQAPCFNEALHAGLCSELKNLYVSITRARKNVWIADSSETSEPMRVFWTSRDLVMTNGPGPLGVSSSAEEWEQAGRSLFKQKRYEHAMQCFQRAHRHHEAGVAHAYLLREEAQAIPPGEDGNSFQHRQAFTTAAEAFIESASSATIEKSTYYRIAAECFKECSKLPQAAQSYIYAGEFDTAALLYHDNEMVNHAVQVIQQYPHKIERDVVDRIKNESAFYYFRNRELNHARRLFGSDDVALQFTETHSLDEARIALLLELDRKTDAANFLISKGRKLEGHELLLQDFESKHSVSRVTEYVLSGLWDCFYLGVVSGNKKTKRAADELLRLATMLNFALVNANDCDEISMFQAIVSMDRSKLLELGRKFCLSGTNIVAPILCFDHAFDASNQAIALSGEHATGNLPAFFDYARLLNMIALDTDLAKDVAVQKLLGIQRFSANDLFVPAHAKLYSLLRKTQMCLREIHDGMLIPVKSLTRAVTESFHQYLLRTLSQVGTVESMIDWPLATRLLYLRRVIHELPTSAATLCEVFEHICGFLIVSISYQRLEVMGMAALHKIILPLAWLQIHLETPKQDDRVDYTSLSCDLVELLANLLRRVYSQTMAGRNYHELTVISRICRCLCLLGQNLPKLRFRSEILRVITSLPKDLRRFPDLSSYLSARTWSNLFVAVRKSTIRFPAYKLVELHHANEILLPQQPLSNVERLTYRNISDLPRLLSQPLSSKPVGCPVLAASQERSAPVAGRGCHGPEGDVSKDNSEVRDTAAMRVGVEGRISEDRFETKKLPDNAGTGADTRSAEKAPYQYLVPSDIEKHAAAVLLHAYQHRLSRRQLGTTKSQTSKLSQIYSECLKTVSRMEWPSRHIYRKLYLGALPHILVCLEEARKSVISAKAETKGRSLVATNMELAELGKRQTELGRILKDMSYLQKILEPTSDLHCQHDISLLQKSALEVQAFFLQFPPRHAGILEDDLALALNAIAIASR